MTDVVYTREEAAALELPPLLVVDPLKDYLLEAGLIDALEDEFSWERIGEGHSNVTFAITSGKNRFVLRRGPRPPLPPTTHDMVREASIQRALSPLGVKTPHILDVCADESLLGVPFYIMEFLDGHVVTNKLPAELSDEEARTSIPFATIDALVDLHAVDVTVGDISQIGKAEGYLERQVGRFAGLWEKVSQRDFPLMGELTGWLSDNIPVSQRSSVVHGDFRIGNLMFEREPDASGRAEVKAILDWEMATLGDPLADVGYFLATYSHGDSVSTPLDLTTVTRSAEFPSRDDLAEYYANKTGSDLGQINWYKALALWKAAVFTEAIYTRFLRGERDDSPMVATLETGVPLLLEEAHWSIG